MSHAIRLKSVFGSTMLGLPLTGDIWFFYCCVSSSSWRYLSYCFMFLLCFILLCLVCMFFCAAFMRSKRWW